MSAVWWTCGSGLIELQIPRDVAEACTHSGPCDDDIRAASRLPAIQAQLTALDPVTLAATLREFGAWDETELADHNQNLQRVLWIACGDIADGNN